MATAFRYCGDSAEAALTTVSSMAWRQHGDGVSTASWRLPLGGVATAMVWLLIGMLAWWDGEGVATPSVRWGGEGVATATGRRRTGRDVATDWRRRRSVWWGRRESWHQRHGHVVVTVLAGRQRWRHPCRWHDGVGWCGGVRWRLDSVDGLVTRVVACRCAFDGVGSMAACARGLAVTLATKMAVLTASGALDVPRSECCAAV